MAHYILEPGLEVTDPETGEMLASGFMSFHPDESPLAKKMAEIICANPDVYHIEYLPKDLRLVSARCCRLIDVVLDITPHLGVADYEVHFIDEATGTLMTVVDDRALKQILGTLHCVVSDDLPRVCIQVKSEPSFNLNFHGSPEDGIQIFIEDIETGGNGDVLLDDLLLTMLVAELKD